MVYGIRRRRRESREQADSQAYLAVVPRTPKALRVLRGLGLLLVSSAIVTSPLVFPERFAAMLDFELCLYVGFAASVFFMFGLTDVMPDRIAYGPVKKAVVNTYLLLVVLGFSMWIFYAWNVLHEHGD